MKIFKYTLETTGLQTFIIPDFMKVLSVAVQNNELVLYAFVDPEDQGRDTKIEISIIGTEHEFLPMTTDWHFRGSHVLWDGKLVWHVWTREV